MCSAFAEELLSNDLALAGTAASSAKVPD